MRFFHQRVSIHKMISLTLIMAGLLSGLLIISCDKGQKKQAERPHIIPTVAVITVQAKKIMLTTELPGRTSAFRTAEIRPQVSGLILKRLFKEGSNVKKGQILYEIDPAPFRAALASAQANLDVMKKSAKQARSAVKAGTADIARQHATLRLAIADRRRFENAFKGRAVSASKKDEAIANANIAMAALQAAKARIDSEKDAVSVADAAIKQAQAAVKTANINLKYCFISAPISGRIGRSSVTEGAIVTAYQPLALASIRQLNPIYVDVSQSTTDMLRLKRRLKNGSLKKNGMTLNNVRLILEDGSEYLQKGILQFSDITVDPTTGSVILRTIFPNPDNVLLPGMFVRAIIQEGINEHAILVPQQGVSRNRKGNPMALIVTKQGKVGVRILTIDRAIGNKWLVTSGLAPGDRVIIEGVQRVRPGTPVKAVPFKVSTAATKRRR